MHSAEFAGPAVGPWRPGPDVPGMAGIDQQDFGAVVQAPGIALLHRDKIGATVHQCLERRRLLAGELVQD